MAHARPDARSLGAVASWPGYVFAADLISFHYAVDVMGAGLGTVMGNLQVVIVALVAWAAFGERPRREVLCRPPRDNGSASCSSRAWSAPGAYGANPQLRRGDRPR